MRAIVLVGIAACASPPSPPCDIVQLPDGSAVRHAIAIETDSAIAISAHGPAVACAACSEITRFDADATMHAVQVDVDDHVMAIASDGGDGYYVTSCDIDSDDAMGRVRAFAADGSERWHHDLPCARDIVVGAEGLYAVHSANGFTDVTSLAPDTGAERWARHVPVANVGGRAGGGVVLASGGSLTFVDAGGTNVATRVLMTTNDDGFFNSVDVFALAPVDGGVAVFGEVTGSVLDLGDVRVDTSAAHSFFAVLDETSTRWVQPVTEDEVSYLAVRGDQVIVAGLRRPDGGRSGSYIGVYSQAGLDHTIEISGPAQEAVSGLAVTADGSIWATIATIDIPDEVTGVSAGSSGLTIEDVSYTNPAGRDVTYLVDLL